MPRVVESYKAIPGEKLETKPGCWKHLQVQVFKVLKYYNKSSELIDTIEQQVGSYRRNYSSLFNSFFAFKRNNKWFALYSKEYMYTRVMSLPDCVDLGGEDKSNVEYENHFCPTDYYVPEIFTRKFNTNDPLDDPAPKSKDSLWRKEVPLEGGYVMSILPTSPRYNATDKEKENYDNDCKQYEAQYKEWSDRHPYDDQTLDFGFVGGCQWGDDTSTKLQFLDLSKVEEGIIKRDARFGYVEMPGLVKFENAIQIPEWVEDQDKPLTWKDIVVEVSLPKLFEISTGESVPDDRKYR